MPLEGRIAIITGAAGALGQATVRHFRQLDAIPVAIDLDADRVGAVSDAASAHPCDLTDETAARRTFEAILHKHGRIDILANIAGGFSMGARLEETTRDDWLAMLQINAVTAWMACACALPAMRDANFGRIVNIGARAVRRPAAKMAPYCVSKAAVVTMTEVLALECADTDIIVNCILPGTIDTPRNRADMPHADHSKWVPPEDIAAVIASLADPSNRSIRGAAVPVYGRS